MHECRAEDLNLAESWHSKGVMSAFNDAFKEASQKAQLPYCQSISLDSLALKLFHDSGFNAVALPVFQRRKAFSMSNDSMTPEETMT
jgi:hypothetical protein